MTMNSLRFGHSLHSASLQKQIVCWSFWYMLQSNMGNGFHFRKCQRCNLNVRHSIQIVWAFSVNTWLNVATLKTKCKRKNSE